jgi:hypothetical protein
MTDTLEFNQRYVVRHGRRILVETLPDPPEIAAKLRQRTQRKGGLFAKVPLNWIVPVAKAIGSPAAVVAVYLKHLEWKHGPTFTLPNGWLERAGVNRERKRCALHDLEAAGIIAVKRWPHRSPQITML